MANGCEISETMAPPSMGGNQGPWEFAQKIKGRLALIGGIDQFNTVGAGVPDEYIRKKVFEVFETVGKDGGYICALSHHFFETPLDKLQVYVDAAHECVY